MSKQRAQPIQRKRPSAPRPQGTRTARPVWGAWVALTLLGLLLVVLVWPRPSTDALSSPSGARTAAIIDQVALSSPNPDFTRQAVALLSGGGFNVDVYSGGRITVDFLRTLPTLGYALIVFRTHSTSDFLDPAPPGKPVFLYTGEPHSRYRYTGEQMGQQIMAGRVLAAENSPKLFIVGPEFVRQSMQGHFEGTQILIGGCDSLSTTDLAQALVERGAGEIAGWSGLVEMDYNDRALTYLLGQMTTERLSLRAAVARTMQDVGADPTYNSKLAYYARGSQ